MAETVYTETTELSPDRLIVVSADGTVTIEAKHGGSWIAVDTLTNETKQMDARGRTFKFTVTGSDSFAIS